MIVVAAMYALLAGCGSKDSDVQSDDDVLVSVGDSVLSVSAVVRQIPRGLDPVDSAAMFRSITDAWVMDLVLIDVAEKNIPDLDRIEHMVETYRNNLIVNRYLSTMTMQSGGDVSEDRVKKYYEANRKKFVLTQPLVKGVLLKVSETDESLDNLRRWMSDLNDETVDKIEKTGLRHASAYRYFRDRWTEWSTVAEQIPYRFFDADAFVRSSKNFETAADGSVYLLHISEYLLSGTEMPYEFASVRIREILRASDMAAFRRRLIDDIYGDKIRQGVLKPGIYDPIKREIKSTNKHNRIKRETT